MFKNIVTHHVHKGAPLPANDARGYQYILAGAGVYLRAENRFFDVLLPLARCPVRGLASLKPQFCLKVPRLPGRLLAAVLADARRMRRRDGRLEEALYHFRHDGARVRVLKPAQRATVAGVVGVESDPAGVILDLHSHGNLNASWSGTDDGDEQGFRVYGVVGRLDTEPEIGLRLGVYGYWFSLPCSALFDGAGGFVDVHDRIRSRRTLRANLNEELSRAAGDGETGACCGLPEVRIEAVAPTGGSGQPAATPAAGAPAVAGAPTANAPAAGAGENADGAP